jgi:murein DD-endopeptidase MepM/ murein hydrolase activator NlpD
MTNGSNAHSPAYSGHHRSREGQATHRQPIRRADYTLGHAGRQVRVGPVTFWIVVGTLVTMASWSLATGSYFAFRDDVLTGLIARQAEMQVAYEDRIAELRAQVDRITGRQLLDQEKFEQKLDQVMRRQHVLESRASSMNSMPDPASTGSTPKGPGRGALLQRQAPDKAAAVTDTVVFVAPPDREARLESRALPKAATRLAANKMNTAGMEGVLARLDDSLDRIETRQAHTLAALEERFDSRAKRIRGVLTDLGVDVSKALQPQGFQLASVGGPFVPLKLPPDATAFDRQLYRIHMTRSQMERLSRTLVAVPLRKPIVGDIETTSGFGVRVDPFIRAPAMHTGLDFRASVGDPVRTTAAGTVTQTGWNGGYGKMVEIDHGNGLSTRYAHLSSFEVREGQTVRMGQIVGRVGSTGRSTGPHLHYETRVDGEAVDPQKFLRAGIRLGSVLIDH